MRKFEIGSLKIHDLSADIFSVGYAIHTPVSGLDFPEIRISKQDKPGEHGAIISAQLYGGRQVDLTGLVTGSDTAAFYTNRRALQAALRIVKNNYISQSFLCKLTTDDGLLLQFYAWCSKFKMDIETRRKAQWLATLVSEDPNLYSQTATTGSLAIGSGTLTNNGDANTFPVLTFNGPLHHPILTQTDLSESFKINFDILSGHSIVVDMAKKTMVLDGTTNALQYFDDANTWLSWIPGTNNVTLATTDGGDTGDVDYDFSDAYVGT